MLEMLRNSAVLRQEASRILLSIAKHLSVRSPLLVGVGATLGFTLYMICYGSILGFCWDKE